MKSLITVQHINKFFVEEGKFVEALSDVSFRVMEGEFLILLGPSGSGKSTLLRLLAGLDKPTDGQIVFNRRLRQSFIFQNFALFPWLKVYENIEFGLKMQGLKQKFREQIIKQQIKVMGLKGFEKSYPRELSGGMKQRVGIARALAVQPEIIYLDEPFSALDSFTAKKLRQELLDIWQEQHLTIVMVTHLIEEAVLMADRIAVLSQRPATIEKVFNNPLVRPRNPRSAEFFALVDKIERVIVQT